MGLNMVKKRNQSNFNNEVYHDNSPIFLINDRLSEDVIHPIDYRHPQTVVSLFLSLQKNNSLINELE